VVVIVRLVVASDLPDRPHHCCHPADERPSNEEIHGEDSSPVLMAAYECDDRRCEVDEEAETRVQARVTRRDWQIFQELTLQQRPTRTVAGELGMTVTAVLMAKSRVQKKLREEIRRLEGAEPQPQERRP
jgi:hypothetical protein